jgi:hypothetical protein
MPSWNPKDISRDAQNAANVMTAYGIVRVPIIFATRHFDTQIWKMRLHKQAVT